MHVSFQVLNRALNSNLTDLGGAGLANLFLGQEFSTPIGPLYISKNGQREEELVVEQIDDATGEFVVSKNYAAFLINCDQSIFVFLARL